MRGVSELFSVLSGMHYENLAENSPVWTACIAVKSGV